MARIPTGNFGNSVATLAPRERQIPIGAFVTGDGLIRAGETLSQYAETEQRRQEEERKALSKTEAALLWTEHENTALLTAQETVDKLQRGEMSRDEALAHYRNQVDKAGYDALGKIAKELKGPTQVKFEGVANRGARAVQSAMAAQQRSEIAGNLEAIRDGMLKQATLPGADIGRLNSEFASTVQALGPQAGLDPARLGKLTQDFSDAATFGSFKTQVIAAQNSIKALQTLEQAIKTDPGLDSDKRLALLSTTQGQITTLQHRAAIEGERRERANEREWKAALDVVQAGKPLSLDYAEKLARQFKGTPYAKPLAELMHQAPQNLAFSAQPLRAQENALLDLQAKGNQKGWSPDEQKQFEKLDRVHRATLDDIKADPWKAGLERGVLRAVAPLNPLDFASLPQALAARAEQSDTLAVWAGRPVSPLRPEEARQLGGALAGMPGPQRADALGQLGRVMTPGQMQALSAQLNDKSPTLAAAALLASRDLQTTKGRQAAEIYLKGVDALTEKRTSFDEAKQSSVRADIHKKLDGAFASEHALRAAVDVAFGVYAGFKSEGRSGDVDQAISVAVGGVMELNGARIVKPYGWEDSRVRDTLRAVTPQRVRELYGEEILVGGGRMSAEAFARALPGSRLGPSPQASTYTIIVGGRLATDAAGRPLLLPLEGR